MPSIVGFQNVLEVTQEVWKTLLRKEFNVGFSFFDLSEVRRGPVFAMKS